MKRTLYFTLIISIICSLFFPATAFAHAADSASGLQVTAPSAVLMEKETGQIIYEKNASERRPPASITKIMTMLLIIEDIEGGKISLDDIVSVSSRAASFGGSCVYLEEGERMSVDEMLKCIAVVSANDCAVAMAEHLSGTEQVFVERMNQRAQELGLKNTHFTNCTGLFDDNEHYTTACDVAIMSRELIKHPMIRNYTTIWMDSIRNGEFSLSNTNKLVHRYEGCTGLKTGYTEAAKYCLSATAERDGMEFIAVVMGSKDPELRNSDATALLNYAFANYSLCKLRQEEPLPSLPVEMGKGCALKLKYCGDEFALVSKGTTELQYNLRLPEIIKAPVKEGQIVGELIVSSGNSELARVPVAAAADVEKIGFWGIYARLGRSLFGL